jgi:hypothetical protein
MSRFVWLVSGSAPRWPAVRGLTAATAKAAGGCGGRGGYGGAVVQEGVAAWCGRGSRVASAWGDNSNVFSVAGRTRRLEVCDVSIIMV